MKKISILFMLLISFIFVGCGSSSDSNHDYKLSSLEIIGGTLDKEFSPDRKKYTVYVDIQEETLSLNGSPLNPEYNVHGLFNNKNVYEFFGENDEGFNSVVEHTVYVDNNENEKKGTYLFEFRLKYEDYKVEVVKVKSGTTSKDNGNLTVENDYYIGKYEVTQEQWYSVMKNNKNGVSAEPSQNVYDLSENYPVDSVTWYETLVFLNRLSILEGYNPVYEINGEFNPDKWGEIPKSRNIEWDEVVVNDNRDGYRLLTDIEWEYAARGGKDGLPTKSAGSDNIDEVAWYDGNSGNTTHPVGEKLPNELGIYDMCGNVWELTFDWYSSVYRSDRGGGYNYSGSYCFFPGQGWQPPYDTVDCLGFRLARDVK